MNPPNSALAFLIGIPLCVLGLFLLFRAWKLKSKKLQQQLMTIGFGNASLLLGLYLFSEAGWFLTEPVHKRWLFCGAILFQCIGTVAIYKDALDKEMANKQLREALKSIQ